MPGARPCQHSCLKSVHSYLHAALFCGSVQAFRVTHLRRQTNPPEAQLLLHALIRMQGENLRRTVCNQNRILIMGRQGAILGDNGPVVIQPAYIVASGIDRRLDGKRHTRHKLQSPPLLGKVRNLRVLVERPADAMSDQVTHNAVAEALRISTDCPGNLIQMIAGSGKLNAFEEALFRNLYQLRRLRADLADGMCARGIGMKALVNQTGVQTYDIPFFYNMFLFGIPCTTSSFTDTQIDAGYPL